MRSTVQGNITTENPFDLISKFGKSDGYIILDTSKGKILVIHGDNIKKFAKKNLHAMKHHISFKKINYILTCYPKYMKKFIEEENIDLKKAKILFPRHKGKTTNSYAGLDDRTVLMGFGRSLREAKKFKKREMKHYERKYGVNLITEEEMK